MSLLSWARIRYSRGQDDRFTVFLTPEASVINKARLDHLASLDLPIAGKRVLEVGAGIGLHTDFFLHRQCLVRSTDGRPENVREMRRRYRSRDLGRLDLEVPSEILAETPVDIIYCYGTLYHVATPYETLRALAAVGSMVLLESCCSPADGEQVVYVSEQSSTLNQAQFGQGCRPTRRWILARLRELWGHCYVSVTQPRYSEFPEDWDDAAASWEPTINTRAIFVGSREPLPLPTLSEVPLQKQNRL